MDFGSDGFRAMEARVAAAEAREAARTKTPGSRLAQVESAPSALKVLESADKEEDEDDMFSAKVRRDRMGKYRERVSSEDQNITLLVSWWPSHFLFSVYSLRWWLLMLVRLEPVGKIWRTTGTTVRATTVSLGRPLLRMILAPCVSNRFLFGPQYDS